MRPNLGPRIKSGALCRFLQDERGGEVIEYALIAGLIIVATISAVASVGVKVLARWNTLKNSI